MRDQIQKGLLAQIKQETAENWSGAYLDRKCIVRWKSNDRIPFADMLHKFVIARYITSLVAEDSEVFRQAEEAASIAAYIRARNNRTPEQAAEERAEARAAFGPGEKIIDIISGETWTS